MAVSGGIKFFHSSKSLFRDGALISASSNDVAAKYALDLSKYTIWESVGSNDVTTETLTLTFADVDIDRLLIRGINWKQFQIKYWNGASWTDFADVIGVNGTTNATISETTYAYNTAYYEFTSVNTDQIQITIDTTQTANEQKEVNTIVATEEIGTFVGYPRVGGIRLDRNVKKSKSLSQKISLEKTFETFRFQLRFRVYPIEADLQILETIHDTEESVIAWLCGGRTGSTYFKIARRGWLIEDFFNVHMTTSLRPEYARNLYTSGTNDMVTFEEAI